MAAVCTDAAVALHFRPRDAERHMVVVGGRAACWVRGLERQS